MSLLLIQVKNRRVFLCQFVRADIEDMFSRRGAENKSLSILLWADFGHAISARNCKTRFKPLQIKRGYKENLFYCDFFLVPSPLAPLSCS